MKTSWQRRRSEINHDRLKNDYLVSLARWLHLLDGRVIDPHLEKDFVSSRLSVWENLREEAKEIIEAFETEMSPRRLLDQAPLSDSDSQFREWLSEVVHQLWLSRCSVGERQLEARTAIVHADLAYEELLSALAACEDTRSAMVLRPFRAHFAAFYECVKQVATAISKFPSDIRVV